MRTTAVRPPAVPAPALLPFLTARNDVLPAGAFPAAATTITAVLAVVLQLALVIGITATIVLHAGARALQANLAPVSVATQLVITVASTVFVLLRLPALARAPLSRLHIAGPLTWPVLAAGLAGGLAVLCATDGIAAVLQLLFPGAERDTMIGIVRQSSSGAMVAAIAFANVVATPVAEELFFRGLIFNALWARLPLWSAACLSGTIFGLYHMNLHTLLPLSVAGVLLALLYARFRSLWCNVVAHAALNAAVVLFALSPLGRS